MKTALCKTVFSVAFVLVVIPLYAATTGDYRYQTRILAEGVRSTANPVSQRKDIVRMGEVITVQEPLFSYGGDVIILANTLKLLAPIDTRPYVQIQNVYWGEF
jgi:hypothetical protein